jgi:DNA repair protein RadC
MKITEWAEADRPREKLLEKGIGALSDAELIAILIGSGTVSMSAVDLSKHILASAGNDLHQLSKLSVKDLQKFKGIGEAKAITIVSALELGRRRKEQDAVQRPRILASKEAYELLKPDLLYLSVEEFWVILLNQSSFVIKKMKVGIGGMTSTLADVRVVFKLALENMATGIIVAHNHPSGTTKPSKSDEELTWKFKEAGEVLDITLWDHLIFTDNGYYSFADEGAL